MGYTPQNDCNRPNVRQYISHNHNHSLLNVLYAMAYHGLKPTRMYSNLYKYVNKNLRNGYLELVGLPYLFLMKFQ